MKRPPRDIDGRTAAKIKEVQMTPLIKETIASIRTLMQSYGYTVPQVTKRTFGYSLKCYITQYNDTNVDQLIEEIAEILSRQNSRRSKVYFKPGPSGCPPHSIIAQIAL